ncbi:MAG: NUDIX hydrolase [Gemmatimonadota bacterium]
MTLLSSRRVYTGRVLDLDIDTVGFPDGSSGELEMIRHPGAAAVVPFLDDPHDPDPHVLLIRQFRHAADGFIWEIPAGRLDRGEVPIDCAHRELREETGRTARSLQPLTTMFATPGFTDERIHLFLASGLEEGRDERDRDEFLEPHAVRWSAVMEMIARGEIQDGKTLVALMFVQCFVRRI